MGISTQRNCLDRRKLKDMGVQFKLKELTNIEDIQGAYDIYKYCMYMPTKEKYENKVDYWLHDKNIKVYACFDSEKIKGIIVIWIQNCEEAEVIGISVDICARRQGIGSYMIQQIKARYNFKVLYAETDDDAVLFYEKNGFEITEVIKEYDGQRVTRYLCQLKD